MPLKNLRKSAPNDWEVSREVRRERARARDRDPETKRNIPRDMMPGTQRARWERERERERENARDAAKRDQKEESARSEHVLHGALCDHLYQRPG